MKTPHHRGFRALFLTQFLGAFNDHAFKNAWIVGITLRQSHCAGLGPDQLVAVAAGLFVLPFVLFSAVAGQLSDRCAKHRLLRLTKLLELAAMALGALGLLLDSLPLSLVALFAMGTQAAFFGPLKYGALPELVGQGGEPALLRANARIESGTFLAILLGALTGTALGQAHAQITCVVLFVVAIAGYFSARTVPALAASAPELPLELGCVRPTRRLIQLARTDRQRWIAILGISWFWLVGGAVLSLLPRLATEAGSPALLSILLVLFTLGIGVGAWLCERLSGSRLELGLVPIGALAVSLFLGDAALALCSAHASTHSIHGWLATARGLRICFDLIALAIASGLFTVPLYTWLQLRSAEKERARVIAANNVVNAGFMVLGSVLLIGLFALGASVAQIFILFALLNLCVAAYAYAAAPELCLRIACAALSRCAYRLRINGRQHLPTQGAALLVCNHVSYVDWMIISAAARRPVRFVMHHKFLKLPATGRIFRDAKVIPIAGRNEDPARLDAAFDQIASALEHGELVCLFPEGELTRDGQLHTFRRGVERVLARTPVPVIPMHLEGLWGSLFSHGARPWRRCRASVTLRVDEPRTASDVSAEGLFGAVRALKQA